MTSNHSRPFRPLGIALALGLPPLLAACGGAQVTSDPATPAPVAPASATPAAVRPLAVPTGDQTYAIVNVCSNKNLDVQESAQANGAAIVQRAPSGAASQQWSLHEVGGGYFRIVAGHSGKGLDVSNAATSAGSPVAQWEDWGGANQQWKVEDVGGGAYEISPRHAPGMRLDLRWASAADDAAIQIYGDNDTCAQRWRLTPAQGASAPDATPTPAPAEAPAV